jgi:glycosyltransferase involved in cell wall biosynthesis
MTAQEPGARAPQPAGRPTVRMLGTRGVPAAHGGFETAADHISRYLVTHGWRVVVYCQVQGSGPVTRDTWEGVERVNVPVEDAGWKGTIAFDLKATRDAAKHRDLCLTFGYNTAGLNLLQRVRRIPNIFNMDGIEWKRERWGLGRRTAFYLNEQVACRIGTHLIADHPVIQDHLSRSADPSRVTMIAYGAPTIVEAPTAPIAALGLDPGEYSTVICRPVAENSLLEIVRAFSATPRDHTLAVLGRFRREEPYEAAVLEAAGPEVVFPGPVYEPTAIGAVRFHSRTYLHGHTVGGTNPSLVEAMGAGNPVIAHDNVYNRWVAGPEARFFEDEASLRGHFDEVLHDEPALDKMGQASRERHAAEFTWDRIAAQYEQLLRAHLP